MLNIKRTLKVLLWTTVGIALSHITYLNNYFYFIVGYCSIQKRQYLMSNRTKSTFILKRNSYCKDKW